MVKHIDLYLYVLGIKITVLLIWIQLIRMGEKNTFLEKYLSGVKIAKPFSRLKNLNLFGNILLDKIFSHMILFILCHTLTFQGMTLELSRYQKDFLYNALSLYVMK